MEISNFITNCVDLVFRRFLMIFTFAAICNKLSKPQLLQEFRSLFISCNEDTGTYTLKHLGQFKFEKFITNCGKCENHRKSPKTQSTQFVIKFENFNFDVWTVKFSPLISCNEDTGTYTLKLFGQFKFEKFITNCGKCENHRKSPKTQPTQFV